MKSKKKSKITFRSILQKISLLSFAVMCISFFISWKIIDGKSIIDWDMVGMAAMFIGCVSGVWYLCYDGNAGTKIGPPGYPF